jgi:hypothetical protein
MDTRLQEHQWHICLEQTAMAEHSVDLGHHIQFHNTSIIATMTQYVNRIVSKAIEIDLHSNNMNTEMGFCFRK